MLKFIKIKEINVIFYKMIVIILNKNEYIYEIDIDWIKLKTVNKLKLCIEIELSGYIKFSSFSKNFYK